MISDKMNKAFNEQINREMFSAYLYLSMSAYAESIDLPGFANWFRIQYQEEMFHAFKMYDYVIERDGDVQLLQIDKPEKDFGKPLNLFEEALIHERKVTGWINDLVALAIEEKDFASQNFLQWFVNEQVEEEATAKSIIQEIKMAGNEGSALYMINRELGLRIYTPPAAE